MTVKEMGPVRASLPALSLPLVRVLLADHLRPDAAIVRPDRTAALYLGAYCSN